MRAIRGAITVDRNTRKDILNTTEELLKEVLEANKIETKEIVSIIFTATEDLDSVYPAVAARQIGLDKVPLLCYQEMKVKNSLEKCIRIMVYINRDCSLEEIEHIYLKKAVYLRPDL